MFKDKHQFIDLKYRTKIDEIDVHDNETTVIKDYLKELCTYILCVCLVKEK